jgi:hypothetical protein
LGSAARILPLGLEVQKAAVKGADATSKVISDQMNFILGMLVDRSLMYQGTVSLEDLNDEVSREDH